MKIVKHPVGRPGEILAAGSRLAIRASEVLDDWYVPFSPRNSSQCAEGSWSEWVALANKILQRDDARRLHSKADLTIRNGQIRKCR